MIVLHLRVCNKNLKILVMSTFGLHSHHFEVTGMTFVEEFILCQIIINIIIIISTHVSSSVTSLSCSPSMDDDGAEIKDTIGKT